MLSNLSSSFSSLALRMAGRSTASEAHEDGPLPLGPLEQTERATVVFICQHFLFKLRTEQS